MKTRLVVIGGGAAGFFGAINAALTNSDLEVVILEKSDHVLSKVKISGGGRCNVTHACFDPAELVMYYPRGHRELRGPFSRFQPGNTIEWFGKRNIQLKVENDGRMFPVTDRSQTIIDCFLHEAERLGIEVRMKTGVTALSRSGLSGKWLLSLASGTEMEADAVLATTGSSPMVWSMLEKLGHSIVSPVPSLFTFNCAHPMIQHLPGVVAPNASVYIEGMKHEAHGPLLITHWGFSGPAILKLSAWAARELAALQYNFGIRICWDNDYDQESLESLFASVRDAQPRRQVQSFSPVNIPQRLWDELVSSTSAHGMKWGDVSNRLIREMSALLSNFRLDITGKSTFKEEFVTAGGILLKEVNFSTMESRHCPGLYFAGEVLDIDAVTGGFNFQAAWTTSWIAAQAIAEETRQSHGAA